MIKSRNKNCKYDDIIIDNNMEIDKSDDDKNTINNNDKDNNKKQHKNNSKWLYVHH